MFIKTFKIFFFLFLIFFNGCGIKKSWEESGQYTSGKLEPSTYVWKKGKQYIAVVQTISVQGRIRKNTIHPVVISPTTVVNSFSKLQYRIQEKGGKVSDLKPVFSKSNIELLSNQLPIALKRARKNQDILFEVFQLRKKFWILPTTVDTTAGYIFLEPGRINIIFEKINEDYQGYDYEEQRKILGDSTSGIYRGKYNISKGWVVLTSKSWN